MDEACVPNTGTTLLKGDSINSEASSILVDNALGAGITSGRLLQIDDEILLVMAFTADGIASVAPVPAVTLVLVTRRGQPPSLAQRRVRALASLVPAQWLATAR